MKKAQFCESSHVMHFDYSDHGKTWLKTLKVGIFQSPIEIPSIYKLSENEYPKIVLDPYELAKGKFIEDGHTFTFNSNHINRLSLKISLGKTIDYEGSQILFHSPSEHKIEGRYYPLEMHLIHVRNDEKPKTLNEPNFVVIGIMFDISKEENTFLNEIIYGGESCQLNFKKFMGTLDPIYITYDGSLTSPPLSEGVQWIIFPNPLKATLNQIMNISKHWQKFMGSFENNREIQETKDRKIFKHGTSLKQPILK